MKKRLTILIPTYNRENLIGQTIKNCFLQTFKDFNILIYDDASSDNTLRVIDNIKTRYPDRITYIKGSINKGIGYARNFLMSQLDTELGMWLDSDDLMQPDRIEKCISYLDKNPEIEIAYSNIQRFTESGEIILRKHITIDVNAYDKNSWKSLKSNTACATGFFRSSLKKYKFEISLRLGGEDVLWIWQLLQNNVKIGHINESLYLYRNHENRISKYKKHVSMQDLKAKENAILVEKIKKMQNVKSKMG